MVNDEYYSRDVSGKEIAIYHSSDLYQWNVWGTDNVGKINANGDKFFYLKDHLGTIRVVLNESNQIVTANDYDCWGYPLEGRSYQSDGGDPGSLDYKFTGKQRDTETGWDYFGARYYDARIANWGGVEPLLEKYISFTPYSYSVLNPVKYCDIGGLDPRITISGDEMKIQYSFYYASATFDKVLGLDAVQTGVLDELEKSMESWSTKEGKTVEYQGKKYKVIVEVEFNRFLGTFDEMEKSLSGKDYINFVENATKLTEKFLTPGIGVGVEGSNRLYLARGDNLKPFYNTGAHELSHLLGLTESDARTVTEYKDNSNTSSYDIKSIAGPITKCTDGVLRRQNPVVDDWKDVFRINRYKLF